MRIPNMARRSLSRVSWGHLAALTAIAALVSISLLSQELKTPPKGFRGLQWHVSKASVDGLLFIKHESEEEPQVDVYSRKGEDLTFGKAKLTRVEYCFSDRGLITVRICTQGQANYERLKEECARQYGPGKCHKRGSGPKLLLGSIRVPYESCTWDWSEGSMVLEYDDASGKGTLDFGTL